MGYNSDNWYVYGPKQLYDVSFILIDISNIDMNSGAIYNTRTIEISNNSSDIFLYNNVPIIKDSNNEILITSLYNTYLNKIITNDISFDTHIINQLFVNYDNTNNYNNIKALDISSNNFITNNITFDETVCSELSSNIINANEIHTSNFNLQCDISKGIVLYNSYIDCCDNILKFNNTSIEYKNNNFTFDCSYIIINGTLKVDSLDGEKGADSSGVGYFNVDGYTTISQLYGSSDDRLKHNETDISNSISIINKLVPKKYIKTTTPLNPNFYFDTIPNNSIYSSGYIAQDISNTIPELSHVIENNNDILSVNYTSIQPYLTQCIKDLDKLIDNIDISINNLSNRIISLENL
tara:strand:+ start:10923 stop:11975 length:1053 start_codon:yes stop_codon:yes gene_type:complete